mgnify:CR=1 FL=1
MIERRLLTILVFGLGGLAVLLGLVAWNEVSIRNGVYSDLANGCLLAALVLIKLYEVWHK